MASLANARIYLEGERYADATDQNSHSRSFKRVYTAHRPYALDGNTIIPVPIRLEYDIGIGDFTPIPQLKDTRGICVKLMQSVHRARMTSESSIAAYR